MVAVLRPRRTHGHRDQERATQGTGHKRRGPSRLSSSRACSLTNCGSSFRHVIASNTSSYHPGYVCQTTGSSTCLLATSKIKEQVRSRADLRARKTAKTNFVGYLSVHDVVVSVMSAFLFEHRLLIASPISSQCVAHLVGFNTSAGPLESEHQRPRRTGRIPQLTRPQHRLLPAGCARRVLMEEPSSMSCLLCAKLDGHGEVLHALLYFPACSAHG